MFAAVFLILGKAPEFPGVLMMLNNGVDVLVALRRLGHSKPSSTLDVYGHMLVSSQNEVADKIDKPIG